MSVKAGTVDLIVPVFLKSREADLNTRSSGIVYETVLPKMNL